jgi:hypothetical protein
MHHLLPLKVKIWIIVILAAVIAGAGNWLGLGPIGLSVIVGVVEFLVLIRLAPLLGLSHRRAANSARGMDTDQSHG